MSGSTDPIRLKNGTHNCDGKALCANIIANGETTQDILKIGQRDFLTEALISFGSLMPFIIANAVKNTEKEIAAFYLLVKILKLSCKHKRLIYQYCVSV